ncbi:MAG: outer membrane beta-barrel protein [Bacteroidetes bacterium]|nr:outer membrane beta-barrel protein [Bacteroidota bacterium]
MKTIPILISLVFISNLCLSQESNNDKGSNRIGITYSSFGKNDLMQFQSLEGSASYDSDNFFTLGLSYLHPFNEWLDLETGIEYSEHSVIINLPPNIDGESYKSDFSIINIPIAVRVNFLKYLFLNGGLVIDIDVSKESEIDSQAGIGGLLGLGVNYDFGCGASVFVNPYIKAHSLISFSGENYPQRLMETGIRIGVTYNLDRK